MALYAHGGPWMRAFWEFATLAQLLANRGYAVLHVGFPSSTGLGKTYLSAGTGECSVGKMQHDLTDAAHNGVVEGFFHSADRYNITKEAVR
ncbi:MAG TPA: hypothetical protein VFA07_13625 [Chthonomonadaceae bacterium]|nr:hypothetical protein [Chthonomonadaceae bacterium]